MAIFAYCLKCKKKREMKGQKQIIMKNGRPATSGTCSVCGTKMFRIGNGRGGGKVKVKVKKAAKKRRGEIDRYYRRLTRRHPPGRLPEWSRYSGGRDPDNGHKRKKK